MAVGGVDDDHVNLGIDQGFGAGEAGIAHRGRRRHPEAPGGILGRVRVIHCLFNILDRDQPDAAKRIIDHQQFFDPASMEQTARFFLPGAERHGGKVFGRHQLTHGLRRVFGKAHIAVGQDTDQFAIAVGHGNAADPVQLHQRLRIAQRGIGADRDRVDHHPAFVPLDRAHGGALIGHFKIAVQHADAAQLRHCNRHIGFGHGIHCG